MADFFHVEEHTENYQTGKRVVEVKYKTQYAENAYTIAEILEELKKLRGDSYHYWYNVQNVGEEE